MFSSAVRLGRWVRRLDRLTEKKRFRPVPVIPETEKLEPFKDLVNIRPVLPSQRTGLLAYKIGCMSVYDDWGERHLVTVAKVHNCTVMDQKTIAKDGYEALQLGLGIKKLWRFNKPNIGRLIKANAGPKDAIHEFRISSDCFIPVGHHMSVRHFVPGQWVFVSAFTKAKGFQGVVKRWGFKGQNKNMSTKGTRIPGAVGQGKSQGHVHQFKKMPGHMGPDPRCTNSRVLRIETERNLVFLKGAIPGPKGGVIKLHDARGKTQMKNRHIRLPYPTFQPVEGIEYPVTVDAPPAYIDPFLYPDRFIKDHEKGKKA